MQHQSGLIRSNKSGFRNVKWSNSSKAWEVSIALDGVQKYIGIFKDIAEANKAAIDARSKYYAYDDHENWILSESK